MENQRAEKNFSPIADHDDSVAVQGLEDLFQWASDTMADGLDGRSRRVKDQQVKRQVLKIIHRSADWQAKAKHADELAYLQRRVIALQAVLTERTEEMHHLKQITLTQYYVMQRIPELEEKIVQLDAKSRQNDQAEEERKYLMNAVAKVRKEKELLEELVTTNETENARLATLLDEAKEEIQFSKIAAGGTLFSHRKISKHASALKPGRKTDFVIPSWLNR